MNGPLNIAANSGIDGLEITQSGSGEALSITGGNALFGDNDKAIFGAGSDLQIYSDGTTGQVTGNVNVTGTVTADGLTVDGDSISFNTTAGDLDINPLGGGSVEIESSGTLGVKVAGTSGFLVTDASDNNIFKAALNGDISFYEDTGTTPKLFWDASAESLGIGTSSLNLRLAQKLDISTSANYGGMALATWSTSGFHAPLLDFNKSASATIGTHGLVSNGDDLGFLVFRGSDGDQFINAASIGSEVDGVAANNAMFGNLVFYTNGGTPDAVARMRIDSSGNVGIGTDSPDYTGFAETVLTIASTATNTQAMLEIVGNQSSSNSLVNGISFHNESSTATGKRIGQIWTERSNSDNDAGNLAFATSTVGGVLTEAMRIDSSGNVSVTGSVTATSLEAGSATFEAAAVNINILETNTTDVNTRLRLNGGEFIVQTLNDAQDTVKSRLAIDNATGDINLGYEDTGTTPKLFWDASAEALGIGTSSPAAAKFSATPDGVLNLSGDKPVVYLTEEDETDSNVWMGLSNEVGIIGNTGVGLAFRTGASTATEAMRIVDSGLVGIGTELPSSALEVSVGVTQAIADTDDAVDVLTLSAPEEGNANLVSGNGPALKFKIPGNTNASYDGARIAAQKVSSADTTNTTDLSFSVNANLDASESLTERMRIDASGDLNLVNTGLASLNFTTDGSSDYARITGGKSGSGVGELQFWTYSSGISRAATIDSSGNLLVGTTCAYHPTTSAT